MFPDHITLFGDPFKQHTHYQGIFRMKTRAQLEAELKAITKSNAALRVLIDDIHSKKQQSIIDAVSQTIRNRDSIYGGFQNVSDLEQELKDVIRNHPKYDMLSSDKKCAIDMIVHKTARIICGDSNYRDNWHDIQGYAKLAHDLCSPINMHADLSSVDQAYSLEQGRNKPTL